MIKLFGVISICFSSVLFGLSLTERLKKKVLVMQSVIQTLQVFKREITYRMPLLSELFLECEDLPTAEFTNEVAQRLSENNNLSDSVHIAFNNSKCFVGISNDEKRFIIDTFSSLGGGDCESQLAIIENSLIRAYEFLNIATDNKKQNSKVYLTTSIYVGIAIAIILV